MMSISATLLVTMNNVANHKENHQLRQDDNPENVDGV